MTNEEITAIAEKVAARTAICTKEILTLDEAAIYMGISKSYLYKLTNKKEIPYSRPSGKMCYFKRTELEAWLLSNPIASLQEIADKANAYCRKMMDNIKTNNNKKGGAK